MNYKESFLQYLQIEKRYSPHTVRSYLNDLDQFECFLKGIRAFRQILSMYHHMT